jgi:hypothetical protein
MIIAINKILRDVRPIEKVCSKDMAHWITAKIKQDGIYEDKFHVFKDNGVKQ